jgi:hypothetical protein
MSDAETTLEKPSQPGVIRKILKWLLIVGGVLFLLLSLLFFFRSQSRVLLEPPFHLLFGWVSYLRQVIPQTQINVELLLSSLGALVLGMIGLQALMFRLLVARRWRWRYTLMWCAMLIVMFSTSIAAVGIVHQTGWLFRLPAWIEDRSMGTGVRSVSHARQVVLVAQQYARYHQGRFPDTYADMMPEIVTDSRIFWVSVDRGRPLEPLIYIGAGLTDEDDGNLPVVWSSPITTSGKRVVARLDGRTEIVPEQKFQAMLASLLEHLAKQQGDAQRR